MHMKISELLKSRSPSTFVAALLAVGVFGTLFTSFHVAFSAGSTVMRVAREEPPETRPVATLRVRVPLRHPGWLVPPLSWVVRPRHQRVVSLDRIGTEVWQACDGRRTVEQIVDAFSERRRLTFHEARAAVTGFLRSLVQRGILAVEMKDS